jgi:hypothetical protein
MEYEERIIKDIDTLSKNLKEIEYINFSEKEKQIVERAKNYMDDASYYLKKKDNITSFGCITYAHGLIDSLRMIHNII